jgi:TolA-binding protein
MALSLQQTTDKGITANYHRISDIKIDFNARKLTVRVASYVSDTYRDHEREHNVALQELKVKRELLDQLIQNASEDNEADRAELTAEINENQLSMTADDAVKDSSVYQNSYDLDLQANYDRATVYELLKGLPEFDGATDV